jgi:hypothetical protein
MTTTIISVRPYEMILEKLEAEYMEAKAENEYDEMRRLAEKIRNIEEIIRSGWL